MISRDVLVDRRKWWNWTHESSRPMEEIPPIELKEEGQQSELTTNQNEEPPEQNIRRSIRTRTNSTRKVDMGDFHIK